VNAPRRFNSARISVIRNRWTLIPVMPTMSARAQRSKSTASTFSSIRVTVCSAGVNAASKGRQATGMLARLPMNGRGILHPPVGDLEPGVDQNDVGHESGLSSRGSRPIP